MKSSTKMPDQKKLSKELGAEILDNRRRYEELKIHGGADPFWPDGVNMNLCRNHVLYLRKRIEIELEPADYPEEYRLRCVICGEEACIGNSISCQGHRLIHNWCANRVFGYGNILEAFKWLEDQSSDEIIK